MKEMWYMTILFCLGICTDKYEQERLRNILILRLSVEQGWQDSHFEEGLVTHAKLDELI